LRFVIIAAGILLLSWVRATLGGEFTGHVVGKDGGHIAQAVVFVQSLPGDVPTPRKPLIAEMDQMDKEFIPALLPIAVGTKVYFPNHDQIHHHVYSFSRTKNFELPLYKGEDVLPVRFDQPGLVKIGCNIHDWMFAIIFVAPTPYFTVSDETGRFTLNNLAPGEYTVAVWHPLSQVKPEEVAQRIVVGARTPEVNFVLPLGKERPRPARRRGGGY